MKKTVGGRVILIGIDGATWDIVGPLVKIGKLPGFKRFLARGIHSKLKSSIPPVSPSAWTSIFTGVGPGKHGIFGFTKRKVDSYFVRPISSKDRMSKPLWRILSDHGIRSVFLNIPFSYPPDRIEGIMTTGLGTPSKNSPFSYPADISKKILTKFAKFDIDFNEDRILLDPNIDPLDEILAINGDIIELSKQLFLEEDWMVFAVVMRSTDVISHYFWNDEKAILKCYSQIDKLIESTMKEMSDEDTLILCSDHGFTGVKSRINMNSWLSSMDWLKFKDRRKGGVIHKPSGEKIQNLLLKLRLRKIVSCLKRSRLIEPAVKYLIRSDRMDQFLEIDWKETKCYFRKGSYGLIDVNIRGREPEGIVENDDKQAIVKRIIADLESLKDENGMNIIKEVHLGKKLYKGGHVNIPDIAIETNDGYSLISGGQGDIFNDPGRKIGDHSQFGMIGIYSRKQKISEFTKEPSVMDISPTILELLGLGTLSQMDGVSLIPTGKEDVSRSERLKIRGAIRNISTEARRI